MFPNVFRSQGIASFWPLRTLVNGVEKGSLKLALALEMDAYPRIWGFANVGEFFLLKKFLKFKFQIIKSINFL